LNVFVLNTGRCGSTTFTKACSHITNFSSTHESRCSLLGKDRFAYPANHIEVDNRLTWHLGRLDRHFGDNAIYVHLKRNREETATSFVRRYSFGIMHAYRKYILEIRSPSDAPPMSVALDYCDTADANIELFLKDKTRTMDFSLENATRDFRRFWEFIGAQGDLDAALMEFEVPWNMTQAIKRPLLFRIRRKLKRILDA
jgi:hypothetical protein